MLSRLKPWSVFWIILALERLCAQYRSIKQRPGRSLVIRKELQVPLQKVSILPPRRVQLHERNGDGDREDGVTERFRALGLALRPFTRWRRHKRARAWAAFDRLARYASRVSRWCIG